MLRNGRGCGPILPDRRRECDTPVLSEERMDAVWKTARFFAQDDLRHSAAFLRDEKASVCKRGDAKVSGDGGIFCQHGCGGAGALYIEFTRSMRLESLIRCHQNAFGYFWGLARQDPLGPTGGMLR